MLNISNYLRNKLLDEAIGGAASAPAATLYIRFFSTTLDRDGAGTELTSGGYAPLAVTNNLVNFPAAAAGAKSNSSVQNFDPATEDWTGILSVGIFDAESGGNLYFYKNLESALFILDGQNASFAIGDISFEFI